MFNLGMSKVQYFHNLRAAIYWRNGGIYFIVRPSMTDDWTARY